MKHLLASLLLGTLFIADSFADVSVADIFGSHMVLQCEEPVSVWGWDKPGQSVQVTFAGQTKQTKADGEGLWKLVLDPMKANAKGAALQVKGSSEVKLEDVLVGEVWLASGQSNMQWSVRSSNNPQEEINNAKHPNLRLFQIPTHTAAEPQVECKGGGWKPCSPETVPNFSAVGYFFGRHLHQELDVPVGIIQSAWGGTRSEAWTSREALIAEPSARPLLVEWRVKEWQYDEKSAMEKYKKAKAAYENKVKETKLRNAKLKKEGKAALRMPRGPSAPTSPVLDRHHPSAIYNAMIAPIAGYQMRGAIWYQGESNQRRAAQYARIFPAMIRDWRNQWGDEFSFHFAQLANFLPPSTDPGTGSPWAELQWAQFLTNRDVPSTGMAIINELGEARDIHPRNKQDVGKRLALLALAQDYGKTDLVSSGPLYRGIRREKSGIRVFFDHTGEGLKSRDGMPLQRFELAGADRVWHWADAKIDQKDSLLVFSKECPEPLAVRYAWAANPEGANLVNSAGLPTSLFRSDRWKLLTDGILRPDQEGRVPR